MKTVLIIEDEVLSASHLKNLVEQIDPELRVAGMIDSVSEARAWLKENKADLLLVDIHLGDDLSFKIFEGNPVDVPIIFTTAYDQYTLKAFKLNSIDYLLKPIQEDELKLAIQKWKKNDIRKIDSLEVLVQSMSKPKYRERFLLTIGQHIRSVHASEVSYFYADGRYTKAALTNGKEMFVGETLEELEPQLDPVHFFRVNRKIIVHFQGIKDMVKYSRSRTKLELNPPTDFDVIVSVDNAHEFLDWLNK